MAWAGEDVRRLLESQHDVAATADGAQLTDVEVGQQVLALSRADLEAAADALRVAMLTVSREEGETAEDRSELAQAALQADEVWRFVRVEVDRGLFNPAPGLRPDASVMARRRAVFAQVLGPSPTDFTRLTAEKKAQTLADAADQAEQAPNAKVFDALSALIVQHSRPAAVALRAHLDALQVEQREDRVAYQALFDARATFDRALAAHSLLVESLLTRADRRGELGRYIRAQDPAYRTRRLSGASLKTEEGISAVTAALGSTPEAIAEPGPTA